MKYEIPLQPQVTVGPDVSVGTIIYRHTFKPSRETNVRCFQSTATEYQPTLSWHFDRTYTPTSGSGGNFNPDKVFETGIPGIGVAVYAHNKPLDGFTLPFTHNSWNKEHSENEIVWQAQGGFGFDLVLIKTGTVSPGTITKANLPVVQVDFQAPGIADIRMVDISFQAALKIYSQTCTTQDVPVDMGNYEVADTFTGKGSVTKWEDASIHLYDCPPFYGILNDEQNTWNSNDGGKGIGAITNNILNLVLTANTQIIDSAKGIFGLKSESGSAQGVGIQLAYGNTTDADLESNFVNFGASKNYTMLTDTATAQTLPLAARYIQTESAVSAGKANSSVTFTINYY
ncbi:fimbrial protein [Kalamiella sp. sgz302252]|uniref:fimbrial protein n=1 Tax=Pantoea sp. sgz302252 TaxID=3341827 RepID=UPI0036D2C969